MRGSKMAKTVTRVEDGKVVKHKIDPKRSKAAKKAWKKRKKKVDSATKAKISKSLKKSFKSGDAKKALKIKEKK